MDVEAPTVRRVIEKLSVSQLRKIRQHADANKFSHSWYWHGPEGDVGMNYRTLEFGDGQLLQRACVLAVAFDVPPSGEPGHFWGAKVGRNLLNAMEHLSEASGSDAGSVNYILELSKLSHEELVSIVDDSLNGVKNLTSSDVAENVHKEIFDRTPPDLKSMNQAPRVRSVLSALSKEQLGRLLRYSIEHKFHHGWYWFGPEGAVGVVSDEERFCREGWGDPLAVAFQLTPSRDRRSWRGCKLDDKFVDALEFWALHAGGEKGMEEYVLELNALGSEELDKLIRTVAAEALSV